MRAGVPHAGAGREEASVMFSGHVNSGDVDAVLDFLPVCTAQALAKINADPTLNPNPSWGYQVLVPLSPSATTWAPHLQENAPP